MYIKAIIKKGKYDVRADGRTPIYLALRHENREKLIVTDKKILPDQWDNDAGMPKRNAPNAALLRKWVVQEIEKLEGIILEIEINGKAMTFETVKERYQLSDQSYVVSFSQEQLSRNRRITERTREDYQRSINNLAEYQPKVRFQEIDKEWLEDYEYYLLNVKQFSVNTASHDFKMLRKFFNEARKKGVTNHYPFDDFKIRTEETQKDYNTLEEVDQLFELYESGKLSLPLQKSLAYYLFSCYTCIPGDDLRHKQERLRFTEDTVSYVRGKTKRKGKLLVIPLVDRAKKLLPLILQHKLKMKKSRVNDDLEEIMTTASINKHITFHCARNTFYVLGRRAGMSEAAIQDVFGHSLPSTTNIYKKIENEHIRQEMNKMNN